MNVRYAKSEDAKSIAEISVETWQKTYQNIIPQELLDARKVNEKRISDWQNKIQNSSYITLVYQEEDNIIGYLWAGKSRDNNIDISDEVYAIYVNSEHQRKGIGKALFQEYKKNIKNKSFYLFMIKGNFPTEKFYKSLGGQEKVIFNRTITIEQKKLEEVMYYFGEAQND